MQARQGVLVKYSRCSCPMLTDPCHPEQKIIGRKVDWGPRYAVLTSTYLAIGRGPTEHILDYFPLHEVTAIKLVKDLAQEEKAAGEQAPANDTKMQKLASLVGKDKENEMPESWSDDDYAFLINSDPKGYNAGDQLQVSSGSTWDMLNVCVLFAMLSILRFVVPFSVSPCLSLSPSPLALPLSHHRHNPESYEGIPLPVTLPAREMDVLSLLMLTCRMASHRPRRSLIHIPSKRQRRMRRVGCFSQ